jgi:hypothetical protein
LRLRTPRTFLSEAKIVDGAGLTPAFQGNPAF